MCEIVIAFTCGSGYQPDSSVHEVRPATSRTYSFVSLL